MPPKARTAIKWVAIAMSLVALGMYMNQAAEQGRERRAAIKASEDADEWRQAIRAGESEAAELERVTLIVEQRCADIASADHPQREMNHFVAELERNPNVPLQDIIDETCPEIQVAIEERWERLASESASRPPPPPESNSASSSTALTQAEQSWCSEWSSFAFNGPLISDDEYANTLRSRFLPSAPSDRLREGVREEISIYSGGWNGQFSSLEDVCP